MAASTSPIFLDTPRLARADISTANTGRDGTGTIVDVFTGGTDGSLIEHVRIIATGTTTAGVVRLFIHNGTNWRLLDEILVTAITPSTTVEVFTSDWTPPNGALPLPSASWKLGAAPHNAEGFVVWASGGDF